MQIKKILTDDEVREDFNAEMSRFAPSKIKERTLDNPEYWAYVQAEINTLTQPLINETTPKNKFDMGM